MPSAGRVTSTLSRLNSAPRYARLSSYLRNHTSSVEVLRDDQLERVLFETPSILVEGSSAGSSLGDANWLVALEDTMLDVPRHNPREKTRQFVKKVVVETVRIRHIQRLKKTVLWWWAPRYEAEIETALFWCTWVICAMLVLWHVPSSTSPPPPFLLLLLLLSQ